MPTQMLAAQQQRAQQGGAQQAAAAPRIKPFPAAAKKGRRLVGAFNPVVGAAPNPIGPFSLTASGGFVRRWVLETILSGGGGTTAGVMSADGPWDLAALITLAEPNNNPIINLSGYNLLLADVYGGYEAANDPRNDPDFVAGPTNAVLYPFLPIELDPTGLGALSDLSSSSGYQLTYVPNPIGTVYTTSPVPAPASQVNVYAEYFTLPDVTDGEGNQQAIVPPRAGTIQMWNQILNIVMAAGGGNQEFQLNRMGQQIRTVAMIFRANGARSETPVPNPMRLQWDDIILSSSSPALIRKQMKEWTVGLATRDTGVYLFPYSEGISRGVGGNGASSWLPTVVDTRYAVSGQFGAATAPTLDWLINDVSRAPLGAVQRTTVGPSGPGFHPGGYSSQPGQAM